MPARRAVSSRVEFTGVNEVSVYSVDKMEMNDYNPSGTSRYGDIEELGDRVQTFKIDRDRSFTGSIDEGNAQDQYNVKGRLPPGCTSRYATSSSPRRSATSSASGPTARARSSAARPRRLRPCSASSRPARAT